MGNTSLIESGRKRIHEDERRLLSLVGIDERDQPREMLGPTMGVQRSPIRPFFDEDEMAGVFLVDEEVIGNAKVFLPGLLDQLAVGSGLR